MAQELHLTQPAVSMQVKLLESVAGLPLTEQSGEKVLLAQAGVEAAGLRAGSLAVAIVSPAKQAVPGAAREFSTTLSWRALAP